MILLSNVKELYDGTGDTVAAVHHHVDLIIDKGRIVSLKPHDSRFQVGGAHSRIDCSEYTIAPGLFDCHSHITSLGIGEDDLDRMNLPQGLLLTEKILHTTLVDGCVTTLRDVGGATHFMKRMVEEGVFIGPRLKIAICMLSTTGGHADFRGPDRCHAELSKLWPEGPGRPSSVVDGPWECRKRVREIIACGADWIKLCTSPGVASPSDKLENRDFTAEEIEAICEEASARGVRVAAHAHSRNGIEMAIRYGVSDIQHISFMDQGLVEMAHKKGCTVTPTAWVVNALLGEKNLTPFVMEKVKKVAEVHKRAVEYASGGGLKIITGTDPVLLGMHGRNFMELHWLIREGLSPLAAWHGATGLAAEVLGETDLGRLLPGNKADLIIALGNILERPEILGEGALVEIVKEGIGYRGTIGFFPQRTFRSQIPEILNQVTKEGEG